MVIVDTVSLNDQTRVIIYSDGSFYLATGNDYYDVTVSADKAKELLSALLAALSPCTHELETAVVEDGAVIGWVCACGRKRPAGNTKKGD